MASPFSMLSLISRRKPAHKRVPTTEDVTQQDQQSLGGRIKAATSKKTKKGLRILQDEASSSKSSITQIAETRVDEKSASTKEPSVSAVPPPVIAPVLEVRDVKVPEQEWTEVEAAEKEAEKEVVKEEGQGEKMVVNQVLALDENGEIETPSERGSGEQPAADEGATNGHDETIAPQEEAAPSIHHSLVVDEQPTDTAHTQETPGESDRVETKDDILTAQNHLEEEKAVLTAELESTRQEMLRLKDDFGLKEERISTLQTENSAMARDMHQMEGQLHALQVDNDTKDGEISTLRHDYEQLSETVQRLRSELDRTRGELEAEKFAAQSLEHTAAELKLQLKQVRDDMLHASEGQKVKEDEVMKLETNRAEVKKQLLQLHERFHSTERQNRMLEDQMRRQVDDLQMAKVASLSTPKLPGAFPVTSNGRADVPIKESLVAPMNALNAEIFQTAAYMADTLESEASGAEEKKDPTSREPDEAVIARVNEAVGSQLIQLLKSMSSQPTADFDPLPVQIALQACFNHCCTRIIASWYPGHWEYSDFLATLYSRILGSENPTSAAKWRATTRAQFKSSAEASEEMTAYICDYLVDLASVVGWTDHVSKAQELIGVFKERIHVITDLSLRLNNMIGEDANLDDLEPMLIKADTLFNPDIMEDAYAEDDQESSANNWMAERAMCTTDMGLQIAARGNGIATVILKPKIILCSILEEFL
ncbi:hypothetical protein BDQ12DRAFT_718262 [Crucibulum laeve]|uniref:Uncharacterized protein n=1 Tax=Crucibulum laeve TaxID=68775 RepID=A0A5C3MIA6_9AGAR|nr:hypothetical protein BDQ12DRAFT_718262 [Crucibulum laeve]